MTSASLSDLQTVAYFALSLASRPLAEGADDVETVSISRPDFVAALCASGHPLGRNRIYAALDELAAENAPALRLIRHAGGATLVLGLLGMTDDIDEGWEGVLCDAAPDDDELDDDGLELDEEDASLVEDAVASLSGLGFDIATPLAAPTFNPRLSRILPAAKRCRRCDEIKPAAQYGTRDGHLRTNCRPCESNMTAAWRSANPDAAKRSGRNLGRVYRARHIPGSHHRALGARDNRGLD